ncbi:ras GTPase-activating-like protein IQGAP2 [Rhincodon typus]|uniref:ras GTPase-activating-like protein IQGAP2 n=1 Tax=Rhincodon typus TaxID=259920 RepID=UPI002030FF27|nr:ras GTPase-activating-like protein IQGAP2 [Rhincodon typus]
MYEENLTLHRPRYGSIVDDERLSAEEMDERRHQNIAYEYLCHLEEAKRWMETCLHEELPPTTELEEGLRNGVYLLKLAKFFAPKLVSDRKIYDIEQTRFKRSGLHFRHTDNTVQWLRAMDSVGLPKIFYPETTDVYDRKNMPRVIYCIHALSLYLFKLGIAPQIQDLLGKVDFTEEEISNMRKELEKYGIQMPAFSKIGGILANELSVDEAALHAAVIAINEAISRGNAEETIKALMNPNAILTNIENNLAQDYQNKLSQAKQTKQESAQSKSDSIKAEERDMYEELLTRMEIQDTIDQVNVNKGLQQVNEALEKHDQDNLLAGLQFPPLTLVGVKPENSTWYLSHLYAHREQKLQEENFSGMLTKDDLQAGVNLSNDQAEAHKLKLEAVEKINAAIRNGDAAQTMKALMVPQAQLPAVYSHMADLYQVELSNLQKQNPEGQLTHEELAIAVEMLSAVAALNEALIMNDVHAVIQHLTSPSIGVSNLHDANTQRYADMLVLMKRQAADQGLQYLSWNDIQNCIGEINLQVQEENEKIIAAGLINEIIDKKDPHKTLEALLMPTAKLQGVKSSIACHYQDVLWHTKQQKCKASQDDSAVLWLDEIQEAIISANKDTDDAHCLAVAISKINSAIEMGDPQLTLTTIQSSNITARGLVPECADTYQNELSEAKRKKTGDEPNGSVWVMHKIKDKYAYYYNLETTDGTWDKPENFVQNSTQLNREEIQDTTGQVTADYHREQLWLAKESQIICLQARARGYLVRKAYKERLNYLHKQEPSVIRLQSSWKGYKQRKAYKDRLMVLQNNVAAVVKIQSFVKMWKTRKAYRARCQYFKDHTKEIIKIQAFLRANKAKDDYKTLISAEEPPLNVVRKFVHLLDQSALDFEEELEVTRIREEVVTKIRSNQQLEKDLNLMDIKIGLLVKNRITLQDVISHSKKMDKKNKGQAVEVISGGQGLKSLSKENRKKLEAYQHLFYLLQTNPTYLAKLIFQMPQNKSTKFMDTVIFSLYNYASNQREEYLLLKLFKTALEEEIKSKVDQVQDIATGNPTVIKMVVTFNRGARGQNALRQLLSPVVKEIMEDKTLAINTNPVEVYKAWVNQMEMQTGEASKLPYDVTAEQALSHEEVKTKLETSMRNLQAVTDKVLMSISTSLDTIPYGMRYIAKVLKNSLHEKFPDSTEDELLKIVGNLLYYRYMNPAIVAPDGFDIIDMTAGGQLHPDQRRNLGSVAKVLQHAASNKLFEGENAQLSSMNAYLSQTYQKFRNFFQLACDVPEPEEKFNIDEYSDMVTLSKPVIYISIEEIINTHSLLLEHQEAISPDHNDLLHELLEGLGSVPDVETLIGEGAVDPNDPNKENVLSQLAKTGVSLTLTSKIDLREGDDRDMKILMIKTKQLIVDVIRTQPGETLTEILETPASSQQLFRREKVTVELDHTPFKLSAKHVVSFAETSLDVKYKPGKLMFKNVLFDITPSEEVGDFEVKAKFMGVEMEKVQLHFQDLLELQYEGVAVMKMFGKAKVNVNLLVFLLNKKFYGK